jgi:hypothetical protein
MKLEVEQPQEVNSLGKVSVTREGQTLEFRARVAHTDETQAGLDLICSTEEDRKTIAELVQSFAPARGGKANAV